MSTLLGFEQQRISNYTKIMEEFKQKIEETLNRLYKENKLSIDAYVELIEFADPNHAFLQGAVEKLNFENETEKIKNRSDGKKNIMRFYFKVKNSKLYNPNKLQHQTRLALPLTFRILPFVGNFGAENFQ